MSDSAHRGRSLLLHILGKILVFVLSLRYRIRCEGLEAIQAKNDGRPILFLPNHPALVDPLILYSVLWQYYPRALADARQLNRPVIRTLASYLNPICMPDMQCDGRGAEKGVRLALDMVTKALVSGDNVLLYPAGRLTRDGQEHINANRGAHSIRMQAPECRIVLIRTKGLWGSSFSYALGKTPRLVQSVLRGMGWIFLNFVFFMPRRDVSITFSEPENLPPVAAGTRAFNKALENFYNAVPEEAHTVSKSFMMPSGAKPIPTKTASGTELLPVAAAEAVSADIREKVFAILATESGVRDFDLSSSLSADLGIDSLTLANIILVFEEAFGNTTDRLEELTTVAHCVLLAAGLLRDADNAVQAPPESWFASGVGSPLSLPRGETLPEVILRQCCNDASKPLLADASGVLSRKDVLLRAFVLAEYLKSRFADQQYIGIMLPPAAIASVVWLAVLLAGKTPVMYNWTVGERNFQHCMRLAKTSCVLTSRRLLEKLEERGFSGNPSGGEWTFLEDIARQIPWRIKLMGGIRFFAAKYGISRLALPRKISPVAVILFTSGSESFPKGVPLSHGNILANCRDTVEVLGLTSEDRLLGMLPPFHSLGLTGNIVLPLVFGVPAVYHANPTESARLAKISRLWRPTFLLTPPTFLAGMLQHGTSEDFHSLRLGFVGAEKCPAALYDAFFRLTKGGVLCEGYGVTECAPAVSVNRPDDAHSGTIGLPLPSVRVAVVDEEGEMCRVPAGTRGMLLVAGPNVFDGYLESAEGECESPFVLFEGHRWYRSGDLVQADDEGRLSFCGRLKRFVKIGGEMLSLPQMESVLLEAFQEKSAMVEGPALALESREEDGKTEILLFTVLDIIQEEANAALRRAGFGALASVHGIRKLSGIPVLGTGKTDYRSLKKLLTEELS